MGGNPKYLRNIRGGSHRVDVYDVLVAFDVADPAIAHAVKKLLCAGIRGKGDRKQDLTEAIQAIERALENLVPDPVAQLDSPTTVPLICPCGGLYERLVDRADLVFRCQRCGAPCHMGMFTM